MVMLKNYLTITLRRMRKQKGYALINITGLAVGMACCLLIVLFVQHEWSYDRFHEKTDRIYRLTSMVNEANERWAVASYPVGPLMQETFPEVEKQVRLQMNPKLVTKDQDVRFNEERFLIAEDGFFDVFDYDLLRGDPATALAQPYTLLLTASTARKYFGNSDPIGQTLRVDDTHDYEVTGILADPPTNAHIVFDFVGSFASDLVNLTPDNAKHRIAYTYFLLSEGSNAASLNAKFPAFIEQHDTGFKPNAYDLIPLTDIHLYGRFKRDIQPQSDARYIYLFSAIALVILIIGCINYMNLATARSVKRAREVGLRKVVGANRKQLIGQFLGESVVFAGLSVVLALALVEILLPFLNGFLDTQLAVPYQSAGLWVLFGSITLIVGLVAGSYPALFLSRFRPSVILKGHISKKRGGSLRHALVVFQFGATVALIVATVIIQQQLHYIQTARLGFEQDQVIVIPTQRNMDENVVPFRNALSQHTAIQSISLASSIPGEPTGITAYSSDEIEGFDQEDYMIFESLTIDPAFIETFGMTIAQGRNFDLQFPSDQSDAVLINEAAVQALGWQEPIGKTFGTAEGHRPQRHVVGVVSDFHSKSMHEAIGPMIFYMSPNADWFVSLKLNTADVAAVLPFLQETWNQFLPNRLFDYYFLDDHFAAMYRTEQRFGRLFGSFAFLAILIACLGLFGLAAYTAEQRTKEIGIRKVLGATVSGLVLLLSKDFVKLVAIAFVIAAPLAYWGMETWLANFAYRISVGTATFGIAGLVALALALGTVSYQAIRAAMSNPVEALRRE